MKKYFNKIIKFFLPILTLTLFVFIAYTSVSYANNEEFIIQQPTAQLDTPEGCRDNGGNWEPVGSVCVVPLGGVGGSQKSKSIDSGAGTDTLGASCTAKEGGASGSCNTGDSCPNGTSSFLTNDCGLDVCCVKDGVVSEQTNVGSQNLSGSNTPGNSNQTNNVQNKIESRNTGNVIPCDGVAVKCDFTALITLGYRIIDFLLFKFAAPFAVILFMWAGFLFMFKSSSEGEISKAKGIFWNVVIGFVVALAAFLIVKLVLTGLGVSGEYYTGVLKG